jgi:hypothetical protein
VNDRDRNLIEASRRNPFWVCLIVFLALSVDGTMRFSTQWSQRGRLNQLQLNQAANLGRMSNTLAQAQQVESTLEAVSFDLLDVARTNGIAAQIVREFNIQGSRAAQASAAGQATVKSPTTNAATK